VAVNFTAWLQQFSGVAIIVAGVYIIIGGNLSMGGLIACYLLHRRAMMPIGQLCSLITRYQRARMTKATIDRMMNLEQEVQDDEVPLKRETLSGAIELRDVTFVYPGKQCVADHPARREGRDHRPQRVGQKLAGETAGRFLSAGQRQCAD
jgi:ATP-binding cassette subfamily C protein LapB